MIEVPLGISWQYKYMIIDTKQTTLVKGLDRLIGQLTGIKYYYEDLETKATLERVEDFKKENHLAYVMSPAYTEPKFDFESATKTDKVNTFVLPFVVDLSANKETTNISSKEHMITE